SVTGVQTLCSSDLLHGRPRRFLSAAEAASCCPKEPAKIAVARPPHTHFPTHSCRRRTDPVGVAKATDVAAYRSGSSFRLPMPLSGDDRVAIIRSQGMESTVSYAFLSWTGV